MPVEVIDPGNANDQEGDEEQKTQLIVALPFTSASLVKVGIKVNIPYME
jgi:hypothetical protein